MSAPAREKPRIPFYWWPFWMFVLALGLFVFYGLFTPVWIAIRLAVKLLDRARPSTT